MARRTFVAFVVVLLCLSISGVSADPTVPLPEPAVVDVVRGGSCAPDPANPYDRLANVYGDACERLHIVFGPILSKPGQNDVLIQPVTFEKPLYDGYITRFRPDLVSVDGVPPVEDVHLHHGTWLNAGRNYGDGPWIASGEEKTIVVWPDRFGLKVLRNDTWLFLHMVHNATPRAFPVWVTYDIDFVPAATAETVQPDGKPLITGTKQIWLDVMADCGSWHAECDSYPFNPIFNAQKGFGHYDDVYGGTVCSYPKENCARFNSEGRPSAQQGVAFSGIPGKDEAVRAGFGGTLVMMGGHVHNGGLRTEVELVCSTKSSTYPDGSPRCTPGETRMINVSDAYYWRHDAPDMVGGPPVSWDFSMSGVIRDNGWAVNVLEGDVLRLNGIYETTVGSWYEQMGIVMTWVVPGQYFGVDPFDPRVSVENGINTTTTQPSGAVPGAQLPPCTPDLDVTDGGATLCTRGQITHPHVPTSGNHDNGCDPVAGCRAIPGLEKEGPLVDEIHLGGFSYGIADFNQTVLAGIPRVKVDQPVTFWNLDTGAYMWHTITRCKEPCTGGTTPSYPLANAGFGADDVMDFDSSELGIGVGAPEPEAGEWEHFFENPEEGPPNSVSWTLTPDRTGVFTFWCRIHPGMRGAINVVS